MSALSSRCAWTPWAEAEKAPPDFRNGKSGGVDALFVLFQALTQNLAKIFMQQPLQLTSWGQRISGAALPKRCH